MSNPTSPIRDRAAARDARGAPCASSRLKGAFGDPPADVNAHCFNWTVHPRVAAARFASPMAIGCDELGGDSVARQLP
jgi:hypothetical protein